MPKTFTLRKNKKPLIICGIFGIVSVFILSFLFDSSPFISLRRKILKPDYNVILLTIDSLRADHLGCYGYERNTSPHIDALAKDSVLFTRAYAQSSFTPPALASLLTSLYVTTHGVRRWDALDPRIRTWAEILFEHGYATGGFVSLKLFSLNNLGQGFSKTQELVFQAPKINRHAEEWLDSLPVKEKIFLFCHYFDVHRPYAPREEYRNLFLSKYAGPLKDKKIPITEIWANEVSLDQDDIMYIDSLYDAQIRQMDADLNEFLEYLKENQMYDNSLIIISADHAEMLGYHPRAEFKYTHDPSLYDGVTRIPLIIKFPHNQYSGRRIDDPVEAIDVLPTVLGFLNIPVEPLVPFQGKDLRGLIKRWIRIGKHRELIFSETHSVLAKWNWKEKISILKGGNKFIYTLETGEKELYNLKQDPFELKNIVSENIHLGKMMYERLMKFYSSLKSKHSVLSGEMSEEDLEMLKSLGYL